MQALEVADPLAHRALQALLRAEASVRRSLAAELEQEGVSAAGFSALVVLVTAGGSLELRTLRRRLGWSKANATEVTVTLQSRGLVARRRLSHDRRAAAVDLTPAGRALVERIFPDHADRVSRAFGALDEVEKRSLTEICRKLAA
jgi:MarR family 2-MHQ and catechol resistance regulon transcriptional repressor